MLTCLFTPKKTELIGLDVGTWAVKLIRLAREDGIYSITAAASVELSEVGQNPSEAIRQCLKDADVRARHAVCAVAGTEVMVRGFKFPPLPLKAIEQAVTLEAQSVCPLDMKNSILDYQLVGTCPLDSQKQEPSPQSGLMVVGTQRLISQRVSQLTAAGVKAALMDAEALALLNCLTELNLIENYGTVGVIDVGHSKTNIVLYGQNGLPFVRDLNVAGDSIERQIGSELGISEQEVRSALCGKPTPDFSTEKRNQLLLALNNAIRPLVMMINETLRFYSFQEKNAMVEKIFLSGGFSLIPMFTDMLADALPVETGILNPLDHMGWQAGSGHSPMKTCGPALAIATGLAMRAI